MKHLYIILLVLPLMGFGQGWEQIFYEFNDNCYVEGAGYSVKQTNDGGYIITGISDDDETTNKNDDNKMVLIKTDEYGVIQWYQNFGEDTNGLSDGGFDVIQTNDDGYVVIGSLLIKTDSNGNVEWINENIGGSGVLQTNDGGYIVVSGSFLVKTDYNGNQEWINENISGTRIQKTTDGGYIITRETCSCENYSDCYYDCDFDVYLIKTNENGQELWSQTYGGTGNDYGWSVQQTYDGGYIIGGSTYSYGNSGDLYLLKTDENGEEIWSQTFGTSNYEDGYDVKQTNDGGFIFVGTKEVVDNYDDLDVYLIKTNEYGNEIWSQTFGGTGYDIGWSVQQTSDGGYIITGETSKCEDEQGNIVDCGDECPQIYLIKTDDQGNISSTIELPTPTSKRELIKTTNILGQENTTIKNQPIIEIYDDGSVEKKYIIE